MRNVSLIQGVASKSSLASYRTTPRPNVKAQITVERTLSQPTSATTKQCKSGEKIKSSPLDDSVAAIGPPLKMLPKWYLWF
jgi:hypothetical protein